MSHRIASTVLSLNKLFRIGYFHTAGHTTQLEPISVVVPIAPKDYSLLDYLSYSLQHISHPVAAVYIVAACSDEITAYCTAQGYIFVDETMVVHTSRAAINYTVRGVDRSGWMFQQLLKLGADMFVTTPTYLVLDADTVLLRPHQFTKDTKQLLFVTSEWHIPYRSAYKQLTGAEPRSPLSFVSHMMLFSVQHLKQLKAHISAHTNLDWEKAILSTITPYEKSCFSEYELYGNWVFAEGLAYTAPQYNRSVSRKYISQPLLKRLRFFYQSASFHSYLPESK